MSCSNLGGRGEQGGGGDGHAGGAFGVGTRDSDGVQLVKDQNDDSEHNSRSEGIGAAKLERGRRGEREDRTFEAKAPGPLPSDVAIGEKAGAVILGLCRLESLLQSMHNLGGGDAVRDEELESALQQIRHIGGNCKVHR
jgi:hypothetical protein